MGCLSNQIGHFIASTRQNICLWKQIYLKFFCRILSYHLRIKKFLNFLEQLLSKNLFKTLFTPLADVAFSNLGYFINGSIVLGGGVWVAGMSW